MIPTEWPVPSDTDERFEQVIEAAEREGMLGLDLEFGARGPHIMAFSSRDLIWAGPWLPAWMRIALNGARSKYLLSAYSGISADRVEIEDALGLTVPLERWSDPLLRFFLCHPNFAAAPGKEEDEDDTGALGLYNLWACSSMYLDVPNWKQCRGTKCAGPCPSFKKRADCSVPEFAGEVYYCGLDAWAGLLNDYALIEEMRRLAIPEKTYAHLAYRTAYCTRMTRLGVPVNLPFVRKFDSDLKKKKLDLFPFEERPMYGKPGKPKKDGSPGKPPKLLKKTEKVYLNAPFNPNSPKAAAAWFASRGINLKDRGGNPSMSKGIVLKKLNQILKRWGAEFDPKANDVIWPEGAEIPELCEEHELLLRIAQLKNGGKGTDSWYATKYIKEYLR